MKLRGRGSNTVLKADVHVVAVASVIATIIFFL